jgi:hypothetical protein
VCTRCGFYQEPCLEAYPWLTCEPMELLLELWNSFHLLSLLASRHIRRKGHTHMSILDNFSFKGHADVHLRYFHYKGHMHILIFFRYFLITKDKCIYSGRRYFSI